MMAGVMLGLVLVLGALAGGVWLCVTCLRGMARATVAKKSWVSRLPRIAFPLYMGTIGTRWVMGSDRLSSEMGDLSLCLNVASIVLASFAVMSLVMRHYARRSEVGMLMAAGFFSGIAGLIGFSLLLALLPS